MWALQIILLLRQLNSAFEFFLVLISVFSLLTVLSLNGMAASQTERAPKRKPQSLNVASSKRPQFHKEKLAVLLARVQAETNKCIGSSCPQASLFEEIEAALKGHITLFDDFEIVKNENQSLKRQDMIEKKSAPLRRNSLCLKKFLLAEQMLNLGLTESGSVIYSRQPTGGVGAVCWSNGRKKKEATMTLCNFPLAIRIDSKGGSDVSPVIRQREYLFDLNGCDLLSVRLVDQDAKGERTTLISYATCLEQWNKRLADATMTPDQTKVMADTIGFCFRERLLPPREESRTGHDNPQRGI
jgi:hypothetical protein